MSSSHNKAKFVALVGTPNSGKSTLFNNLTGLNQKVGNFPGVTVEPKSAYLKNNDKILLVDLPGTYSLQAASPDERFTVDVLLGTSSHLPKPDAVVVVVEAIGIEKGLFLLAQLRELEIPCFVVTTMIDEVKKRGSQFDDIALERSLGVQVLPVVGNKGIGVSEVASLIENHSFTLLSFVAIDTIEEKIRWARFVRQSVLIDLQRSSLTEKLDSVLLHSVFGPLVFFIVMWLFFQSIFTWSEPLMTLIDSGIAEVASIVATTSINPYVKDFVTNGLLAGVGSVIVFLPQIVILSLFISVLEDCGYLSRAAFVVDRFMGVFGLQGRSFIPLLGSFACAIPGIMSTRIIPDKGERISTILVAPLMTCSARLPVYSLLIGAFVPAISVWGVDSRVIAMAALYAVALMVGLFLAWLFKRSLFKASVVPFLIEFPPYRIPTLKSLVVSVWQKSKDFISTAGTTILLFSIVLWFATSFPNQGIEKKDVETSYAGIIGKSIQPIFAPIGFDWKTTIGVLGSFSAREVFVSTMAQVHKTNEEDEFSLRAKLRSSMSSAQAYSILAFYLFALQCISTMAIIKRELGSWKWSAFSFVYMFVLAYFSSFLVYSLFK